ncbi:MAG: hypothetical protein AB7Q29_15410 [Vicinamibacterales bacterium]
MRVVATAVLAIVVLGASVGSGSAQPLVDAAMAFYERGGAYCFRVAPFGVSLAEEGEWTVMLLTSTSNTRQTFRIRSVDPGDSGLKGSALRDAGRVANEVWKADRTREAFLERFAQGMRRGSLRARVVNAAPPNLAQVESDRARADLYLRFADRGSKVSFERVPDLSPGDLQQYEDYFPD